MGLGRFPTTHAISLISTCAEVIPCLLNIQNLAFSFSFSLLWLDRCVYISIHPSDQSRKRDLLSLPREHSVHGITTEAACVSETVGRRKPSSEWPLYSVLHAVPFPYRRAALAGWRLIPSRAWVCRVAATSQVILIDCIRSLW